LVEEICIICEEEQPCLSLECGHFHCSICVTTQLKEAVKDKTLLPIRCEGIPLDTSIVHYLLQNPEERNKFLQAELEVTTKNKLYCPVPTCSKFIQLDKIQTSQFTCPGCGISLCSNCKTEAHPGVECSRNNEITPNDSLLLTLVNDKKWRRCDMCRVFIEHRHGCRHMTCLCGYEFCYTCGAKWKQCTCELWEEPELLDAVERRQIEPDLVQEFIQRMRRDECIFHAWGRTKMRYRSCENCGYNLRHYGFQCETCRLTYDNPTE